MTPESFDQQMQRLIACYGKNAYPQPRADLIWVEFKAEHDKDFEYVVSRLIGERQLPPMLSHIREEFAKYRERRSDRDKADYSQKMREAYSSTPMCVFIYNTIEAGQAKELEGLVGMFGLAWVEARYERGKKLKTVVIG